MPSPTRHLVIVESPAKARTIGRYLGAGYDVAASVGHVMDLPRKELGVDLEDGFEPQYVVIRGKAKVIQDLKARARKADRVVLATDPDREGEAIAGHVASQLGYDACFLSGLGKLPLSEPPHRPTKILYSLTYREEAVKPSFVVDITEQIETKLAAIRCYSSQFDGRTWAGEVFPGGERPLYDQVRMHAARYGSLIRTEYGEPFYMTETMAVDDLVTLGVRSI